MTFKKFWDALREQTSCDAFADNIVGDIMDTIECWDWNALVPEKYIRIHLTH